MSNLMEDTTFKVILFFLLLVLGINIGIEVYPMLSAQSKENSCTSGVIKERVERIEPTSEEGVNKVMKYYTLECDNGYTREVKAFKNFPLETRIGKEWVRQ